MSQCVPSWDVEENHPTNGLPPHAVDTAPQGYEVAELTWENGQLSMHGLAPPRVLGKPISSKYTWEKPRVSGTLEAIVNQAAKLVAPLEDPHIHGDELVPWYDPPRSVAPGTMAMDALVPSHLDPDVQACVTGKSTRVESCEGTASLEKGKEVDCGFTRKRSRAVAARDGCSRNQSVSFSETFGRESRYVVVDSCEMDINTGFTSTSLGSDTNPNTPESVSHRGPQKKSRTEEKSTRNEKSTISTKRSRAAAIHNQSERKRRDKINQKMKTLQKMVPNSSKTDKASMLDEVIDYLKTLQAQVQMMSMMSMPHMNMMMPTMNMQQQLQMAMMAQMGMGMGMGVMDMNTMGRAPNMGGMPQVLNPAAFMPMASWDAANDRGPVLPDPMATFLACQTQPMSMDAYRRMAAMHQQLQQQQQQASKP